LRLIHAGDVRCVARDTPEPSPLSHEIINAKPYAFLDDAPLEERRTQAVYTRRAFEMSSVKDLGALDADAIERVRQEAWPEARSADELHDALLTSGFLTDAEGRRGSGGPSWEPFLSDLIVAGRAARVTVPVRADAVETSSSDRPARPERPVHWVVAERLGEMLAVFPDAQVAPPIEPVSSGNSEPDSPEDALRELVRSRTEVLGPTTADALADSIGVAVSEIDVALVALEAQGAVLRGSFTPGSDAREWCDRRLLARIHRYTLNRLRAEIEPVSTADFMRFLLDWQRVLPEQRAAGVAGVEAVVSLLDGFELPAAAWESDVLPARCEDYEPDSLDLLCLTGRVGWGRLSPPGAGPAGTWTSGPLRSSPIGLFLRSHADAWLELASRVEDPQLGAYSRDVLAVLESRGASFFEDLVAATGLLATQVEEGLGELVALGLATSDSFAGLRALLTPSSRRRPPPGGRRRGRTVSFGIEAAGRWSPLRKGRGPADGRTDAAAVEEYAWVLLRRYGVVFRTLLEREANPLPWRDLLRVYRRLEARGDIRGGRFVAGLSGEQFALSEAVGKLRTVRRAELSGRPIGLSAADPLNLTGIITPGDRVPALATNRVVYLDGVPVAARVSGEFVQLARAEGGPTVARAVEHALTRRPIPPAVRAYLGVG
ncbi:MAG: ATP-dependent DNA helicase, partial [Gemmatimonadetes bacterium]|nr:ATP-dependent DNA helicase [Gemmatimonadota bacterium]